MLRVVLPFFKGNLSQMADVLRWAIELNPEGTPHNCLVWGERGTDSTTIHELATQYFKGNVLNEMYEPPPIPGWPAAPNWVWQNAARFMDDKGVNEPWLFWESDAIPLYPNWLDKLWEAYLQGGKPFAGHIVDRMDHMNGVGIYPPDVRRRCEAAMMTRGAAWDYVLKDTITGNCTKLNHLIQHIWNISPEGYITNGDGKPVSFQTKHDLVRWMDFNCVLLHRCKDHSVIHRLKERQQDIAEETKREELRKLTAVETNVPVHIKSVEELPQHREPFQHSVAILIVTYAKDAPWLEYCLALINKYCRGFKSVTVAFPKTSSDVLIPIVRRYNAFDFQYDEITGRGMIQHMAIMGLADQIVRKKTEFVMHLDADCMYHTPTRPEDYFVGDKPVYLMRSYEKLVDDKGVVSDCYQWKGPTESQLGFPVSVYTMTRHPNLFPITFYRPYREHIERQHARPFMDYMTSGKNTFPQDRMDWTAMGAFAYHRMQESFHWIDLDSNPAPRDRQKTFWSHAGVTPESRALIESYLSFDLKSTHPSDRKDFGTWLNDHGLIGYGAEIGVLHGAFSEQILSQWNGKKLHLIDPWERQKDEIYREETNRTDKWYAILEEAHVRLSRFGERAEFHRLLSVQAAANVSDDSLDFAYIDANHAYEFVAQDLELWWPKVKPGGMFCGHDYENVIDGRKYCEVKKAVDEFVGKRNLNLYTTGCTSWWIPK